MKPAILNFKDAISKKLSTPRSRRWIKRVALALALYTVLGFFVLPIIIRAVAVKQLAKELRREVRIKKVRLNPYAFSISIRGLEVKDPDTQTLLAWDEVYVNLRITSILGRAWTFDEIAVVNPYARVQVNKDYSLNFSDILEAHAGTNAAPKSAEPAKPVAVAVRALRVEGAKLDFTDLTPSKPFHRTIGPVKIELTNFRTDPDSRNPHVFTGSTDTGETFSWGGNFSLNPVKAAGELAVENIALKELAPLYQDLVRFEIRDGVAAFRVNYAFEMSAATTNASVSNLTATLRSFKLGEPDNADNLLELPEFSVTGVNGDLLKRNLEVGAIAVRGAGLNVRRGEDAKFNVVEAATPNAAESAPGGVIFLLQSATNLFAQLLSSTNLASATVHAINVEDCAVNYQDDSCVPPVSLSVDQIGFTARHLSNRPETNMTVGVSLRWNTNGMFKTAVNATLAPLNADVDLHLDQIELAPLSPYLRPFVNVYVLGSKVGLDGRIHLGAVPGELPDVTFAGDVALDDLNVLGSTSEDMLKWGALHFDGIAANLNPASVTVSNVTLKDVAARVVIETNHTINVLAVLPAGDTNAADATETMVVPASAASSSAGGGGIKQFFAQVKTVLGMDTNVAAVIGMPKVEVNSVRVENADVQFLDRSVNPPARASLQKMQAMIEDISTEEMRRAKIHVQTLVGGTGPIEITALLNPLHAKQATEAKVSLKNVQLTPADPYAGKFLGYRLTRGKLDVDVTYTITASELKGRNVIVLDQLTLGGKVQSPDATSLPVKLGIALLKDSSGKIEIDVPVEGNLDDPKFRFGKVIWGVVANVFVKAVTSPFSLLGSLVGGGGGEEMQFQEFAAGSTELDAVAREKLATFAKALEARPELQVAIEGNVQPELDGWALRKAKVEQQLRLARWNSLRASARENLKPEDIALAPEIRVSLIEDAYRDLVKTNPQLAYVSVPASVLQSRTNVAAGTGMISRASVEKGATRLISGDWTPPAAVSVKSAGDAGTPAPTEAVPTGGRPGLEQMENSLAAAQTIVDEDFAKLAAERARQVQAHLVQELNVAAERVFVGEPGSDGYATNGNRAILQLQ